MKMTEMVDPTKLTTRRYRDGDNKISNMRDQIFEADHTAFSKKIGKVIMMREAPEGHTKEDFVLLSGTKVRAMLSAGEDLPPEFARPEVARIMMDFYQDQAASKNEPSSKSVKGEETKSQD